MAGKVINGSYPSGYYLDPSFQSLTIATTATVLGAGVTTTSAHSSTILNSGTVDGAGNGISLMDGGTIRNGSASDHSAYIGGVAPIVAQGAATSINNFGVITSYAVQATPGGSAETFTAGASIQLKSGGLVTNEGGIGTEISISGGSGRLVNSGTVDGTYYRSYNDDQRPDYKHMIGYAVDFTSGGSVLNGSATNHTAALGAISISGGVGSINNSGTIGGTSYTKYVDGYGPNSTGLSVQLLAGGTIVNGSSSNSSATLKNGVSIAGNGRLVNYGSIGNPNGIDFSDGGSFTRYADYAAYLESGSIVNEATGAIGGARLGSGSVTNLGTLTGFSGYYSKAGYHYNATTSFSVVIGTAGTVINGSSTNSTAMMTNGISIQGAGSITNYGTIGDGSGFSILFANATDTLVEEGTGTLAGSVKGGGGKLILGARAGAGTIAGIGSTINGFATTMVQAGGAWTVNGATSIATSTTFENDGTVTFTGAVTNHGTLLDKHTIDLGPSGQILNEADGAIAVSGSAELQGVGHLMNNGHIAKTAGTGTSTIGVTIDNAGTIETQAGTIDFTQAVSGTAGTLRIDAKAGLEFDAAVAGGQTVAFNGTKGVLTLEDARHFAAVVSGFEATDTIDLKGLAATSLLYVGVSDKLFVRNGSTNAAVLQFSGAYSASGFTLTESGGDSLITYAPPAAPHSAAANVATSDPAFTKALFDAAFDSAPLAASSATSHGLDVHSTLMSAAVDINGAAAKGHITA